MPSACGSRSCLCQSVYPCGELFCRARRGGYHPPEAFPPVGGRWMAEGQTDEGFPRSHAWVPLAGRACPAGAPISSRRNGGKEGSGASPPEPPKRGLMAAVGCTGRAKTGSAFPPALSALTSQALPRLGRHASGLPCKPRKLLRCTNLARRAAVGAMPLKYHGGRGSCPWGATTRRAVRGAQGRPKTRKPRAEFTRPVQRSRFQVLRGDRRVPPERGSAGTVTAGVPGALDARLVYAGYYTEHRRRAPLGPGAVPLVFLSPHFFGKKWGRRPRRRVPRGSPR